MSDHPRQGIQALWESRRMLVIASVALLGIVVHLVLRFALHTDAQTYNWLVWIVLAFGGPPLVLELAGKALKLALGSHLLEGISIVTAVVLGEYLAGAIVVLML